MTITYWARAARSVLIGAAFVVLGACGGSSTAKKSDTTPTKSNTATQTPPSNDNKEPAPIEQDAVVTLRENMLPPVDAGGWVCEPKSWGETSHVRVHCTAPAGSTDLIGELKKLPEVVTAEPAS
jgi:hypothetical protein